jgi:gas vesicle protein
MDNSLKYKIVEKIIQSNDENLLNEIKSLIGLSETDFWTEIPEEIKKSINKAKEELDRGEGLAYDDVMDEIKSRFLNK